MSEPTTDAMWTTTPPTEPGWRYAISSDGSIEPCCWWGDGTVSLPFTVEALRLLDAKIFFAAGWRVGPELPPPVAAPTTDAPTLWAGRDKTEDHPGDLYLFRLDPECEGGDTFFPLDGGQMRLNPAWLPDLPPGCKVQVRLVACGDAVKGGA